MDIKPKNIEAVGQTAGLVLKKRLVNNGAEILIDNKVMDLIEQVPVRILAFKTKAGNLVFNAYNAKSGNEYTQLVAKQVIRPDGREIQSKFLKGKPFNSVIKPLVSRTAKNAAGEYYPGRVDNCLLDKDGMYVYGVGKGIDSAWLNKSIISYQYRGPHNRKLDVSHKTVQSGANIANLESSKKIDISEYAVKNLHFDTRQL